MVGQEAHSKLRAPPFLPSKSELIIIFQAFVKTTISSMHSAPMSRWIITRNLGEFAETGETRPKLSKSHFITRGTRSAKS
jgi:hypothetical protein